MTIRWVVFDLGDVVLRRTVSLPSLAGLLSVEPDPFTQAYWAHRASYDLRSDPDAFWSAVAAGSGAAGPSPEVVAELVRLDDLGWNVADPDVLSLIDEVKAAGVALAVLSNAPASMGRLIETAPWAAHFDHLLFSGDLGLVKPAAEIFSGLLGRLAADPGDVVFLDDRADNIAGAIAAGIHGLVFTGAAQAAADLRALGIPVRSKGSRTATD